MVNIGVAFWHQTMNLWKPLDYTVSAARRWHGDFREGLGRNSWQMFDTTFLFILIECILRIALGKIPVSLRSLKMWPLLYFDD